MALCCDDHVILMRYRNPQIESVLAGGLRGREVVLFPSEEQLVSMDESKEETTSPRADDADDDTPRQASPVGQGLVQ